MSGATDMSEAEFLAKNAELERRQKAERARKRGDRPENVLDFPTQKTAVHGHAVADRDGARGHLLAQDASGPTIEEPPASRASASTEKAKPLYAGVLEQRVEPGRYIVAYVGHRSMQAWNRRVWLVAFKILDFPLIDDAKDADRQRRIDERRRQLAPFLGVHVPRFVNAPDAKSPRPAFRSTFALDWTHITGRRPPRELARFTPAALYSSCTLEVELADVLKDSERRLLHDDDRYSVVRKVIQLRDGSPPCMQGRKP